MLARYASHALAASALFLAACGDARPVKEGSTGGGLCVTCHGGTDNDTGAPPKAVGGDLATTFRGVGAHTSHVEAGPVAGAFDCGECHVKPTTLSSPGHNNGTVEVVFGALAHTGTANPAWNGGATPPTCSSVYCHGATLGGGAGTVPTPIWTTVDGSQASCGKCHQLPPPGHPALAAGYTNQTCAVCHPQTVRASDGLIDVAAGKHVNGQLDVLPDAQHPVGWLDTASTSFHAFAVNSGGPGACMTCHVASGTPTVTTVACSTCHGASWTTSCTMCHGGTDNSTGAPPRATWGNQADAVRIGVHTSHVQGTHNISAPVACGECHLVPADAFAAGHIDQPTATLTWGTLATTGGAVASWTRTSATCANYCHGGFANGGNSDAPIWTGDAAALACTACHGVTGDPNGIAPRTGRHPTNWSPHAFMGNNCQNCHSGIATGSTSGTPSIVAAGKALHVNGTRNVSFSGGGTWTPSATGYGGSCAPSCHGTQSW